MAYSVGEVCIQGFGYGGGTIFTQGVFDNSSVVNLFNSNQTGRRGGTAAQATNASQHVDKTFGANYQDWTFNCALNISSGDSPSFQVCDNGTVQVELAVSTGKVILKRNTTALGTSSATIPYSAFTPVELLVHIADGTAGWAKVNVAGSVYLDLTGIDTQATTNAYASQAKVYGIGIFDDLMIRAGTSLGTADALFDVGVTTLRPNADSTGANWSPSAGSVHYTLLDETTTNEDTDYDSSAVVGAEQALGFTDPPTGITIHGLDFSVRARKDDVGVRTIKLFCKSGTAVSYSPAFSMLDTYRYCNYTWRTDPYTGSAWTAEAAGSATFGYRLES